MKHVLVITALLAAIVLLAVAGNSLVGGTGPARVSGTVAARLDPGTLEHRIWAAEQMTARLTSKLARSAAGCSRADVRAFAPEASKSCTDNVTALYPVLKTIREIAASGDEAKWLRVIEIVHKLEADLEAPLNTFERTH